MVNAAIQQSVAGGRNENEKRKVMLMTQQEMDEAKSFARELRTGCSSSQIDMSLMQGLLDVCKNMQNTVKKALEDSMKYDPSMVELEELFLVNDTLLDAIGTAKAKIQKAKPTRRRNDVTTPLPARRAQTGSVPRETKPVQRRQTTKSLEIDSLVRKRDVFSLICMLRAQSDKRVDSALALMR